METAMEEGEESYPNQDEERDITRLCRVCANPNEYLIPIYHGEGLEHDLKAKISRHLPIKVQETDCLPLQLCYQCASTLIAWHDMVTGCSEADAKLRALLPHDQAQLTLDEKTGAQVQQQVSKEPTKDSQGGNNALRTEFTGQDVSDEVTMGDEMSHQRSMSFRSFQLAIEAQRCKLLLVRCVKYHKTLTDMKPRSDNPAVQYPSQEALKTNATIENTHSNFVQATNKTKPTCNICNKEFSRVHDLKRHSLTHFNIELLEKERTEKGKHFIDAGLPNIPLFTCQICSRIFKKKDSFERHQRIHTGERPFECSKCQRHFRDTGARNRHMKQVHARVRSHECLVCNKWFVSKSTMMDHMKGHGDERSEQCEQCGLTFKTKNCLYQHVRTHSNVLAQVCAYCGRGFRRRQELKAHLTTHTQEKAHICDKCGKGFNSRSVLSRHAAVHLDEKPHVCNICGAKFSMKRYLKNHFKSRHEAEQRVKSTAMSEHSIQVNIGFNNLS